MSFSSFYLFALCNLFLLSVNIHINLFHRSRVTLPYVGGLSTCLNLTSLGGTAQLLRVTPASLGKYSSVCSLRSFCDGLSSLFIRIREERILYALGDHFSKQRAVSLFHPRQKYIYISSCKLTGKGRGKIITSFSSIRSIVHLKKKLKT